MELLNDALVRVLPAVPRPLVRRIAARYIAGSSLEDAVRVVKYLNGEGKLATIDVLGEEIHNPAAAGSIVRAYEDVFSEIARRRLDSNVSVKPTGLGLELGYELCRENLERVVAHAAASGNFVRVDMEDASTTDATLALYQELRAAGHVNLGVVLQASLRRTLRDVRELVDLTPNVRLCKGIYVEAPEVQFRDADQVRASFVQALDALLGAGAYVAIATHDEWLVDQALARVRGLDQSAYEFQTLLGVRSELADRLVADGHRLRVYVPYGEHWYGYSLRRLQENPVVAGSIARDVLTRLL